MIETMNATDTLALKRCPGCHRWLVATTENFHRCSRSKDGLAHYCKPCATAASSLSHARRRARERGECA